MQDKFAGIEEFLATVETGSFSGAGEKLAMTGSAVGKSITRLEERLGTQLFHRSTRKLTLPREGEVWLASCRRMMDEMEQVQSLLCNEQQEPVGEVRIDLPNIYGRIHLLPKLLKLANQHPKLRLNVSFEERKTDLIAEQIDLSVRFGLLGDLSDIIARQIGQNQNRICAAPAYLNRHGTPQTPTQLSQHSCISGNQTHWLLHNEKGESTPFAVNVRHQMNDGDARLQSALTGLGLVQLPDWLVEPYIQQDLLVPVLTDYEPDSEPIYVLWQKKQHLQPKIKAVVEVLSGE
ncbi:LysR substrate-binding domain-containing protein [Neisseria sp. ZJ106]|uniref:LysR substrate-binding domain-containing protein n=1 Tax=Neisseria lisongii TaxID=2912188 RepID=A0ABY7RH88_9NEIS|nr:LysR substrate-binding domain-containing protein [Neisseria lisongii]MCF7521760.1 LysR substrate-binding domain-containing protein [Neisseria lisongii]WCL70801.1 LysR substrate-binding domain-containing protein [Neisseria lisongii]